MEWPSGYPMRNHKNNKFIAACVCLAVALIMASGSENDVKGSPESVADNIVILLNSEVAVMLGLMVYFEKTHHDRR
jgi:hypothetical protein